MLEKKASLIGKDRRMGRMGKAAIVEKQYYHDLELKRYVSRSDHEIILKIMQCWGK